MYPQNNLTIYIKKIELIFQIFFKKFIFYIIYVIIHINVYYIKIEFIKTKITTYLVTFLLFKIGIYLLILHLNIQIILYSNIVISYFKDTFFVKYKY